MVDLLQPGEVISYAQNREDIILAVLLYGIKKGFYVDVGANGPLVDSVTRYFYENGWHGINIEPNPDHAKSLRAQRKRDVNLQVAVGAKTGTANFREYLGPHHGLSTVSPSVKKEHMTENMEHRDYEVDVLPLKDILSTYAAKQPIDFLKIDVEGMEHEVIGGNDWKRFRPKIVVAEISHVKKDWRPLLEKNGYKKVFFDGLNEYYASDEYAPSINFDAYIRVVTEGAPIVSWQEFLRRRHLSEQYESDIAKHRHNISELQASLQEKDNHIKRQRQEIDWIYAHPFRFAFAKLYHYYIKRDRKVGDK